MKLYNLCVCLDSWLYQELIKHTIIDNNSHLQIKEWKDTSHVFFWDIDSFTSFLDSQSHDYILRIIYIWIWKVHTSSHINTGDILLPNTFISHENKKTFFIDYALWFEYDLEKFILHLNGVCIDKFVKNPEDFCWDIEESHVYSFLSYIDTQWLIDKSVVVLGTKKNQEHFIRISAIVDMITTT